MLILFELSRKSQVVHLLIIIPTSRSKYIFIGFIIPLLLEINRVGGEDIYFFKKAFGGCPTIFLKTLRKFE